MRVKVTIHHDDPGPYGLASDGIAPPRETVVDGDWDLFNLVEFEWANLTVKPRFFAVWTVGGKHLFSSPIRLGARFQAGDTVVTAPGGLRIELCPKGVSGSLQ